jgi:hypothetical protein
MYSFCLCYLTPQPTRLAVFFFSPSKQELKRFESMVKRAELAALAADVGALRAEMLRLEDELLRCQVGGLRVGVWVPCKGRSG